MSDSLNKYRGKKVLITGNTGFKGSWLSQWLVLLGANVYGYALEPTGNNALFNQLNLAKKTNSSFNDIRDLTKLKDFIQEVKPDIIFHLAAQALVRESYEDPIYTIETNINGTVHVLEAVRQLKLSTNIVIVTSDKCYDNKEWIHGYRENDPMGGFDPYSVSKGAAELIVSAWRNSYFSTDKYDDHGVKLASARAGNVIGGGDWSNDRIIPDCIRALKNKSKIVVRNPLATRPWQHILESLGGYLLLGSKLIDQDEKELVKYCSGFNFGPFSVSNKPVKILVEQVIESWGEGEWTFNKDDAYHEAFLLNLSIDKAFHLLNWQPTWNFETTIKNTIDWYKQSLNSPSGIVQFTEDQINKYNEEFLS